MIRPNDDASGMMCKPLVFELERQRLDMHLLIDDSMSMLPWWQDSLEAIDAFLHAPASAGVGIGIQFFGTSCDVASYVQPRVPIGVLPDNLAAIQLAFPALPLEESATRPALEGAITYLREWATLHPDHKVVLALVTDGVPEECGSTLDNVAEVARNGLEQQPSIATHVVVLGALAVWNSFAEAGGAGDALFVAPGSTIELVRALETLRDRERPCTYVLPRGTGATNLALSITRSPAEAPSPIPRVADAASCDRDQGGWYYDDPAAPACVHVCPPNCRALNMGGTLQVAFGCS